MQPAPPDLPGDPRDPNRLAGASYFLTTLGAGLLLAQNWKRLGKPEWVRPTQIASLVGLLLALASIILGISIAVANKSLLFMIFVGGGAALGINFGIMLATVRTQVGPFKAWKTGGVPAMLAYPYRPNTTRNTFIVVFALCMAFVVGVAVLVSST